MHMLLFALYAEIVRTLANRKHKHAQKRMVPEESADSEPPFQLDDSKVRSLYDNPSPYPDSQVCRRQRVRNQVDRRSDIAVYSP